MRELLPTIAMNENVNKKDDYDEYMEYVLTSNKGYEVPYDFGDEELRESIREKGIMNEKQLSTFSVLLSEFFSEDGIIFSKCGIDNAILDKLYQLDYAIDGSEPDIIKRHFIVLFDNIYRSLSTSDTEKSKSLLDLLKILRREIIGEELEGGKGMSNCNGRITTITSYLASDTQFYDDFIIDILLAKNGEEDFVYNIHYDDEEELRLFFIVLREKKVPVGKIRKHINFIKGEGGSGVTANTWIRARDDGVKVIGPDGKIIIVKPASSRDQENCGVTGSIEDTIAVKTGDSLIQSDLIFQGGNIRQTDKYAFIGSDDILINVMDNSSDEDEDGSIIKRERRLDGNLERINDYNFDDKKIDEVIKRFQKLLGKEIIPIGLRKVDGHWEYEGTQPNKGYHIDLFITPLDDENILMRKKPNDKDPFFNNVKTDLENKGFKIHTIFESGNLNYNNVLLENYINPEGERTKIVYLPWYYNREMRDNRKKANDLKNLLDTVYNGENLSDEQRQILEEEGGLEELKIQYNELIKWIDTNLNKLDHEKENNEAREVWKNLGYEIIPISMDDENPNTGGSLNCRTDESRVFDNK